MGGRRVQVVVIFLDILAMIPLIAGQAVEPLFQNRIAAIPKSQGEAQALMIVGDAGDSVLSPAVSSQMRVLEGKIFPGCAIRAVVLAHRAPLALGKIGTP